MTRSVAERVQSLRRSARAERLRARAVLYLLASAAVILCSLGFRQLIDPPPVKQAPAERPMSDLAMEDFAQRFARAYLSFDSTRPAERERALRGLVSEELDPEAGLIPRGDQQVEWTQVAQNQEAIAGGRVVVVAAGVSAQEAPLYVAVPVARDADGAIGLTDYPSLIGPPTTTHRALVDREEVEDREVVAVARRALANYLAIEAQNLAADLAPAAQVSLPTLRLRLVSVEQVDWAAGVGSSAVLVTATARDERGSVWTLTYELGIAELGGRTHVTFIETVPNAS